MIIVKYRQQQTKQHKIKRPTNQIHHLICKTYFWCGGWDLNPHVNDTRTSNVPVCLFQHRRKYLTIITASFLVVNPFFHFFVISQPG